MLGLVSVSLRQSMFLLFLHIKKKKKIGGEDAEFYSFSDIVCVFA
jgi:hypothetical protein